MRDIVRRYMLWLGTIVDLLCRHPRVPLIGHGALSFRPLRSRTRSRSQTPVFPFTRRFFPARIAWQPSRRDPQFSQPGHQILQRPVALDAVAVGAQKLQVLDVVLAATAAGDDVVHFEDAERELAAAPFAPALLSKSAIC